MLTPWFMKSMTMPALVRLFQKKNTLNWSKRAVAVYINSYLTTYGKYDGKHWQIFVVYFSCLKIVHTKMYTIHPHNMPQLRANLPGTKKKVNSHFSGENCQLNLSNCW